MSLKVAGGEVRGRFHFFVMSLLFFKCINNLAATYLKELISLRETKRISMRLDDDFFVSKVPHLSNFSRTETAFQYNGPMIWNSLP